MRPMQPAQFLTNGFEHDRERVRAGFWRKLRRLAWRLPFVEEAIAAWYCALDPTTPPRVKVILMAALAYFVLPSDAVPDFLVGFGFSDDAAVLLAALRSVAPHIHGRHRAKARAAMQRTDFTPEDTP